MAATVTVPRPLAQNIAQLHGEAGTQWLRRLPRVIADCERRWSIEALPPFPNLSYSYIAPARRADGTQVVLKVHVPSPESLTEIEGLRTYDGTGCVRLLDADPEQAILLLERLAPGTPLLGLEDDEEATRIIAGVMRRLRRPAPRNHRFPTIADWANGLGKLRDRFEGGTGPLPSDLVERAEGLFRDLLASMGEQVLLHGDLHHENILAAEREPWLAIDPKGVAGEPAFEIGPLFKNPLPRILCAPDPHLLLERRVDILHEELGFDKERIFGWALAQTVLAAWWCIEDGDDCWERFIACARVLAALRGS